MITTENTITYHDTMLFGSVGKLVCYPKILHKQCLQFLFGVKIAPRETENNAYMKFSGDGQRALWYAMVFCCSGQLESHSLCTDMSCADAWVACEYIASLLLLGPFSREMSAFWH